MFGDQVVDSREIVGPRSHARPSLHLFTKLRIRLTAG
jgi:hypothetical protein